MDMQDELMDRFGDIPKAGGKSAAWWLGIKALAHQCLRDRGKYQQPGDSPYHVSKSEAECGRYTGYGGSVPRGFEVPYGRRTVFYVHRQTEKPDHCRHDGAGRGTVETVV